MKQHIWLTFNKKMFKKRVRTHAKPEIPFVPHLTSLVKSERVESAQKKFSHYDQ